jgi:hypothetical protein
MMRKKAEQNTDTCQNVVMPRYEFDSKMQVDREVEMPDKNIFLGMGWNKLKTDNRKHYRRFYPQELEKEKDLLPKESPFNTY